MIGQNSSRYDHILIIKPLIKQAQHLGVNIIPIGNAITSYEIGKFVVFRDSYLFFSLPLKILPKTFGFEHKSIKLDFPHMFNKRSNYNYVGRYPKLRYYQSNMKRMKTK